MYFPPLSTIKKRRQAAGATQKQLASLCNVGQSFVTKIERGIAVPSYPVAIRIFEAIEKLESEVTDSITDLPASKVMTRNVISVRPEDDTEAAVNVMLRKNISQLPVINKSGLVVGAVTERSLLGKVLRHKTVQEVMDGTSLVSVSKETKISIVRAILVEEQAALVLEKSALIGIITKYDLIRSGARNG